MKLDPACMHDWCFAFHALSAYYFPRQSRFQVSIHVEHTRIDAGIGLVPPYRPAWFPAPRPPSSARGTPTGTPPPHPRFSGGQSGQRGSSRIIIVPPGFLWWFLRFIAAPPNSVNSICGCPPRPSSLFNFAPIVGKVILVGRLVLQIWTPHGVGPTPTAYRGFSDSRV